MNWAEHLISFYRELQPPNHLPNDIAWLYPQKNTLASTVVQKFFDTYYNDTNPRQLFLGINPGRFGAGVTGVNFTGPKQLLEDCKIDHHFGNGTELSAEFIYKMIHAYGGVQEFYKRFFIGSVCPLGFTQQGRNLNYYDDKKLLHYIEPFIVRNMEKLISFNTDTRICFCIGGEKNFKHLSALNNRHHWFENIKALPHPRFIMQYRRKQVQHFVHHYLEAINK